ncbi:glycosyltransferase family 4 protein [Aeromonas hydrophila]|uniref:glycosyltransferase family 4 protein n=1 Tax=Aeromonas hydrophila TaxID=644 RepID=UPI003D220060
MASLKMKKILIFTSEFKRSGPNNVVESIVHGLNELGSEVHVASLRTRSDDNYISVLRNRGAIVHRFDNVFSLFYFFKLLRKISPDVVNTHGFRADILSCIYSYFFKHIRFYSTIHNNPTEDYKRRYGILISFIMNEVLKIPFKSKRIKKIAVSKSVENVLLALGCSNSTFIYNGIVNYNDIVHMDRFENKRDKRKKNKIAIYCGHLSNIKNPFAIFNLAKYDKNTDFYLLGDGPLKDKIPHELNNLHVMGRVNNVHEYMSIADFFIMPSYTEGMPMALIEAMSHNLPCLCSRIPIFEEISGINNACIELFDLDSQDDLIEKFESIKLIGNCYNRHVVEDNFTSVIMAKRYLEEFNR